MGYEPVAHKRGVSVQRVTALAKALCTDRQAEALEEWVREELEEQTPVTSLWSDLLTTAIGRVNWYEIAKNNR